MLSIAPSAAAAQSSGGLGSYIIFPVILLAMYFLMIRPQRARAQRMKALQSSVNVGSEVITTAGVYGRIVAENEDDTVLLEIAPGVPIRIARAAIARPIDPVVNDSDATPETDEPPAST
ncbi:MAG: preprotein translocase subunit YajC [Frankiaceae bacterium]|nr:preprotein translocase subunit YajC [Frankiaceae bacterium]